MVVSKKYFGVRQLSIITGMTEKTLYKLIRDEKLASARVGRRILVPAEAVEQLLGTKEQVDDDNSAVSHGA